MEEKYKKQGKIKQEEAKILDHPKEGRRKPQIWMENKDLVAALYRRTCLAQGRFGNPTYIRKKIIKKILF